MAKRERVAFLGLGTMGRPQAANLARAGFELTVFNRTQSTAERFSEEFGASLARTPAQATADADVTITMLPDGAEVDAVLFDEQGAAEGLREGSIVIDMSTIAPRDSVAIGKRLREEGIGFLDAPVSGSEPKAVDGTLTIMVGGEAADFDRVRPVLDAMGELVVHVGPQGHGSVVKLINNTLAATNAAVLAETLQLARRENLDTDAMRRVVAASSGASAMLNLKAEPMLTGDFKPLFKLEFMLKDVRHFLDAAREHGVSTSVSGAAEKLYTTADRDGHGGDDFAAVTLAVEKAASREGT
jgi:3-hydroxyisobutyrate dehydrogenase-like beta-hydroxyacid dehydrogenase